MSEHAYEQEINLQKMLYRILRDWRKWFLVALVIAVIGGAGNFVVKGIQFSDPEKLEREKINYERELTAYMAEGESLQREIENLEEMRIQQETYNEASILMKINPFREFTAFVQLYISTDYQILPDLTYQNIDISSRVLRAYVTYMQKGDMYQYIQDHLTEKVELRYLQELITITVDYSNCMMMLSIQGVDEQSCNEMMTYAIEGIQEKKEEILEAVGEHELSSMNRSINETVDLDLDEWQKNNRQYILDLNVSIKEKVDALAAWSLSQKPRKGFELASIVKDSVKNMFLYFVIVIVIGVGFIAFRYIISDKVQDAKDLKNRFGLRVIAQIPKVHKKRVCVWVDRVFARMCGLTLAESDVEQLMKVTAQSINAELSFCMQDEKVISQGNSEDTQMQRLGVNQKIIFTGSIGEEEMKKLLSGMEWESGISISSAPNILCAPSAIPAVMDADYVILVEKQEESRYSEIERELEELAAWKKEVLGVIVLGVDGIPA